MTGDSKEITSSMEDYLEAIFHISKEHKVARAKQIASRMNVAMSSVTGALKHLSQHGLVNYDPYEYVTLTKEGRNIASDVVRRHSVFKSFLMNVLSVPEALAEETACKMEHAIRGEVLERFLCFAEFVESCPRAGADWLNDFNQYHEHGRAHDCERCLQDLLDKIKRHKGENNMPETVGLDTLAPGQKGKVVKVGGEGETRKRIADMGVVPGATITMERVAPLGDPIEVTVKGYHLSLRKKEAKAVAVQLQ
ncbi:MAG TPA: metal-dependent transcriptional regulator [bacterium]|nr:metal-dependent transcriptional regulator [bacterium]